jgi:hypothetical protein
MEMVAHLRTWAAVVAVMLFAAAAEGAEHQHSGAQNGVLSLDVYMDVESGRVHLLTGESEAAGGEAPVLLHRVSKDGGATWSKPVRVNGEIPAPHGLHRGADAQIAVRGDRIIAAWTTAGTDRWGSGPIATTISTDGGLTWTAGSNPADDGLTTGHGFIDLATDSNGTIHATWLDSRDGKQGVRYAHSVDQGRRWSANATLKPASCECCPNVLATAPNGFVGVLFRDGNPRNMALALSSDHGRT